MCAVVIELWLRSGDLGSEMGSGPGELENIIFDKETHNKLNVSRARVAKGRFKESAPGKGERDRVRVAKRKFKESGSGKGERNRIRVAKGRLNERGSGKGEWNRIKPFCCRKM